MRLLQTDWQYLARPSQLPPEGDWFCWLILAGRGFGKTRAGAEWLISRMRSGLYNQAALIGETAADVRDVMVEGPESGILAISPRDFRPVYEPSKRKLTWPNGAIAHTYSGEDPDQLRGPQHDTCWADEPAKWRYADLAWDMMELGLRLGPKPQVCATTTPKPTKLIRALVKDPDCRVTSGSTYDNIANLAPAFIKRVVKRFEGTRLGQQELWAKLLDDVEGALWQRTRIDELRVTSYPPLVRIVVAVDPAVTDSEDSDETGIVVAGVTGGSEPHGYVLADRSLKASPHGWASAAVAAYHTHRCDRLVAEVNNGGDMVEATIRTVDPTVAYKKIHASRGKQTRAEPVAALYEQGRVHHVGLFADLEDQMCNWTATDPDSPDRVDALVWALTELLLPDEVEQQHLAMPMILRAKRH